MTEEYICFYDSYWNCQLPVCGSENSAFLHMGIEFGPFSKGDLLRDARLPDGWSKELAKDDWYNILDNNGSIRGKVFEFTDRASMYPEKRFSISKDEFDLAVVFSVLDADSCTGQKRKRILKRRFVLPDKKRFKTAYDQKLKDLIKSNVCEKWLDKHFPKWRDCNAYWGDGEVTVDLNTHRAVIKK